MEKLILEALAARLGGDVVRRANYHGGDELFRLAPGLHHIGAVMRELAQAQGAFVQPPSAVFMGVTLERAGYIDAKWQRRFYRAWRRLSDCGLIEFPSLVPFAGDYTGRAMHLADGLYLSLNRSDRRYARLVENAVNSFSAKSPAPVTCRKCGTPMPGAHHARKLCSEACRKGSAGKAQRGDGRTACRAPANRAQPRP
jgi:hypothetical protein